MAEQQVATIVGHEIAHSTLVATGLAPAPVVVPESAFDGDRDRFNAWCIAMYYGGFDITVETEQIPDPA